MATVKRWASTLLVVVAVALGIVSASEAVGGPATAHPVVRT